MLRTRLFNQELILSVFSNLSSKFFFTFFALIVVSSTFAQTVLVERTISNTVNCNGGYTYGTWLNMKDIDNRYTLHNGVFTEYDDNTATFTGRIVNNGDTTIQFMVETTISGRTYSTPTGSPKASNCGNNDTSDWYYYTATEGTFTGIERAAGALITFDRMGPSFQVGTGANQTEGANIFNACGWLNLYVTSQPTDNSLIFTGTSGDFNFNLSGTPLTTCDNLTHGGQIGNYEVKAGPFKGEIIENITDPSGGTGTIQYMWLKSNDPNLAWVDWTAIDGANAESYDPGQITETTYFLRCARRQGCTYWDGESNIIAKIINGDGITCDEGAEVTDNTGNAKTVIANNGSDNESNILGSIDENYTKLWDNGDYITVELEDTLTAGQSLTISWKSRYYSSSYAGNSKLLVYESLDGVNFTLNATLETLIMTYNVHQTVKLQSDAAYIKLEKKENTPDLDLDAISYAERTCQNVCSIGDRIWEDLNANGIQDDGEPGLGGVFIFLEDTEGNALPGYDYALSDANGFYSFTELPCDTFVVRFATPSGYYLTQSGQGGDGAKDSDANILDGRSIVLDLGENNNITNLDAGYYHKGSMIGRIWVDSDANGQEASDEDGVTEVKAQIFNAGPDMIANTADDVFEAEMRTDNLGFFEFFNLTPGFYFIRIDETSLPIGYNLIVPEQGEENFDSDIDQTEGISPVFEVISGGNASSVADGGIEQSCSFMPTLTLGDATCQDFAVNFSITPNDNANYTYLWEFFDESAASNKLAESTTANADYTWTSAGEKAFRVTITDNNNCSVTAKRLITILSADDSDCLANLPVELINFSARLQANKTTIVEWSTAWELDNNYFEVQRSYDGERFENIGMVYGAGTTEQINRYSFVDETPYFGRTYYRLKQIDFDGTTDFSEVVSVLINAEVNTDVIAQPNPTKGRTTLRLVTPFESDATIEVVSPTGQVLEVLNIPAGAHTQEINLERYQPGFYLLNIKYNGFQQLVHRVMKVRD